MTKATCSRCGKRFKIVTGAMSLDEYMANDEGEFGCEASETYNLCPECSDGFMAFLMGGIKE